MNSSSIHCIKWSQEEDRLLLNGVLKYGTKWFLVKKYMKNIRTINSIVKRWHTRVKKEAQKQFEVKGIDKQRMSWVRTRTSNRKRRSHNIRKKITTRSIHHQEQENKEKNQSNKKINQEKNSDEKNQHSEKKSNQSSIQSEVQWQKDWNEQDDEKLRYKVLCNQQLDWKVLAKCFDTSEDEVRKRWCKVIYPKKLKHEGSRVGGFVKWSVHQDHILSIGYHKYPNWAEVTLPFFPLRTLTSVECRWRRIGRKDRETINVPQNKYLMRKQCLQKIALKNMQYCENTHKQ